ncbi:MAG TPA: hypothetical protein DDW90_10325 [Cyanobacteria bacterium UBA9971]|nr:hypothetical protein [Cyanobacteria bacterium UBA9971]
MLGRLQQNFNPIISRQDQSHGKQKIGFGMQLTFKRDLIEDVINHSPEDADELLIASKKVLADQAANPLSVHFFKEPESASIKGFIKSPNSHDIIKSAKRPMKDFVKNSVATFHEMLTDLNSTEKPSRRSSILGKFEDANLFPPGDFD